MKVDASGGPEGWQAYKERFGENCEEMPLHARGRGRQLRVWATISRLWSEIGGGWCHVSGVPGLQCSALHNSE